MLNPTVYMYIPAHIIVPNITFYSNIFYITILYNKMHCGQLTEKETDVSNQTAIYFINTHKFYTSDSTDEISNYYQCQSLVTDAV